MNIYLHKYNVTPNIDEKEELVLKIENDTIVYSDIEKENNQLINEIKASSCKGGRQKQLSIYCEKDCNKQIVLVGNTDNKKTLKLYDKIKNQIIDLLKN